MSIIDHTSKMQPLRPDYLSLQFDVNGTIVFGDTTKKVNALIFAIARFTNYKWDINHPEMSYVDYVQKVLIPGDKCDEAVKKKQEQQIAGFLETLKQQNHPLCQQTSHLYETLAKQYLDKKTQNASFTLFPSVMKLIQKATQICPATTCTLRTFGFDGPQIAHEWNKLNAQGAFGEKTLEITHRAYFANDALHIEGDKRIRKGHKLFKTLHKAHTLCQDDFETWHTNKRKAAAGKRLYCVHDGNFEGKKALTIFFDDNLNKRPKGRDRTQPADPDEQNIAFPVDIYARPVSWDSAGVIGIRVNPIKAALDEDYLINKVNKQLIKRGFASF